MVKFELKKYFVQENAAYLTLWAILIARELFNAVILCFFVGVKLFSGYLGCLLGCYLILVVVNILGAIFNLIRSLLSRDDYRSEEIELEPTHLGNIYNSALAFV